jgi:hypothetical protein
MGVRRARPRDALAARNVQPSNVWVLSARARGDQRRHQRRSAYDNKCSHDITNNWRDFCSWVLLRSHASFSLGPPTSNQRAEAVSASRDSYHVACHSDTRHGIFGDETSARWGVALSLHTSPRSRLTSKRDRKHSRSMDRSANVVLRPRAGAARHSAIPFSNPA